ncbi:nucleotidyltransferase family protein [Phosphitispora sp. TUW77]|uniref:nucleotidyltransferase domain-containing protein n=1 Tax=Phosphitispora sp. TUW77 TaxID=3152361 RepID=UPI003AB1C356
MCESGLLRIFKTGSAAEADILDWNAVLNEAQRHQVMELLAKIVKQAPEGAVPSEVVAVLKKLYSCTFMGNLWRAQETENIILLLEKAGIRCIILKGIALAERLYGDIGVRNSWDIDLLVERDKLPLAVEALELDGYEQKKHNVDLLLADLEHDIRMEKKTAFGSCWIELHYKYTHRRSQNIDMEEVWERARAGAFGDGKTLVWELSPLDLLLSICMHSAGHNFIIFRTVLDVVKAIEVEGRHVDWNEFVRLAKKYGVSYRVYASLYYAFIMFHSRVPAAVLADLKPPAYIRYLLAKECLPDSLPKGLTSLTSGVIRNEGVFGYLFAEWRRIFPPILRVRTLNNVGAFRALLFYPKRLVYLVSKPFGVKRNK